MLGGGGARGFAHLGALRAFQEARIPIDIVGGTSMGAIVGAQYAMGYTLDHMIELNRRCFVHTNPISDYTIPLVSLIAGDRMSRTLKKMFGDARIEDQWLPYFCVATNLSRATIAVHQQGSLAFAVGTSIAVPGLAPPLIQNGDFLVDGGLLENVPVGVMRRVSQGRVFTVDVSKRVEFTTTRKPYGSLSGWRVLREQFGRIARRATRAEHVQAAVARDGAQQRAPLWRKCGGCRMSTSIRDSTTSRSSSGRSSIARSKRDIARPSKR